MTSTTDDDPHPAQTPAPAPAQSITLQIIDPLTLLTSDDHSNIQTWARSVFSLLHAQHNATGTVQAKVVNDNQMSHAHQQFSGIPGTTDVLTFDLNEKNPAQSNPHTLDIDLLICYDQATRQAPLHNHTTAHELLLYIIHGTLHCLGYNDLTPEEFNKIHTYEDQLLTDAGIGPLFHLQPNNKGPHK